MFLQKKTINNVPQFIHLTADTGTGAPVGSYLYLEKKSNPQGYLYCDGSTFDETVYPALYQYLGTNVLPDWREFSAVGAEQNTTNVYDAQTNPNGVIHDHDVYTEGQAKDDQLQNINGSVVVLGYAQQEEENGALKTISAGQRYQASSGNVIYLDKYTLTLNASKSARAGTVTRGKSRAVFIYIKATSGLTENQQENVLNTINENNSYSTEEHPTGKKWIDGKPTYEKTFEVTHNANTETMDINTDINGNNFIVKCDIVTDIFEAQKYQCFGEGNWNDFQVDYISNGGSGTKTIVVKFGQTVKTYNFKLYVTLEYTKTTD